MKERIGYFDSARAILIVLVVLGHVLGAANPRFAIMPYTVMQNFISSFHMPAFFIISGILVDVEKWGKRSPLDYVLRRVKTLVVPYFFLEAVAIIYRHFALGSVSLKDGLLRMLTLRCNVAPDWFLTAMFFASLIFYIYIKLPKKPVWAIVAGVLMLALYFVPQGHWWNILLRAVLGFAFMVFGNVLKRQLTAFSTIKITAAFILLVICVAVKIKFSIVNSFYGGILESPPLFFIGGLCGTYLVLGIARHLDFKWIRYIGENSLVIMSTHPLILSTIPHSSSVLWVIGTMLLTAAVELVLIVLTNKLCPFLIGKGRAKAKNSVKIKTA